jgi:hypothetical protein
VRSEGKVVVLLAASRRVKRRVMSKPAKSRGKRIFFM